LPNELRRSALVAFLLTRRAVPVQSLVSLGRCGAEIGVAMSTARLLALIRREFQDHPGIVVTLTQAQSRWCVDKRHCRQAFEALLAEGFLRQIGDAYLWSNAPTPRFRIRDHEYTRH
jgi:hypothetical protein